ncbi:MAG: isochorismatase [Proteobacteria bacterium]|nr:MAG: isochorismatase [Pseudomonadota bacterium]
MKTTKTAGAQASLRAYELATPAFFDRSSVGEWKRPVKYADRFRDALDFAARHGVRSAALDGQSGPRIALLPIDSQLTFCHPDFELYVGGRSGSGAIDDAARLCDFIYRNLGVITSIHPTMDTHLAYQIFHAGFLVDEAGNSPDPHFPTLVAREEILAGKWKVNPKAAYAVTGNPASYAALQAHLVHYAESLAQGGKYALTIWPFHAMLGGLGHALVPAIEEAIFFHAIARGAQVDFQIKGGNPLTENYSVLRPEVLTTVGGKPLSNAQKNTKFLKALLDNDAVVIAGQAKSHCVAWTIEDLLGEILSQDPELVKKVYLLDDCTSSVVVPGIVDFTQQGDDAFRRFAAAGMHVVSSTTPIEDWPGIKLG